MTQKIVVNTCYGGFGLSRQALHWLRELNNNYAFPDYENREHDDAVDIGEMFTDGSGPLDGDMSELMYSFCRDIPRDDEDLVAMLERKGTLWCSAPLAKLAIVEIPDGVEWQIEEYDGMEWVAEKHRTWWPEGE